MHHRNSPDVTVPIGAAVLVPEACGVHEFVDGDAPAEGAREAVAAQIHHLTASLTPHEAGTPVGGLAFTG